MADAPPRYLLAEWQRIHRPSPALPTLGEAEGVLVVRPDDPVFAETLGRESLEPAHEAIAFTRHLTRLRESIDVDGAVFVLLGEWDATREDDPFEDAWAFYRGPSAAIAALLAMGGAQMVSMVPAIPPSDGMPELRSSLGVPGEARLTRAPPPLVTIDVDGVVRLIATGVLSTEDVVLEVDVDTASRRALLESLTASVPERYDNGIDVRTGLPVPGTAAFERYLARFGERIFVQGVSLAALDGDAREAAIRGFVESFHVPQARPSLPPALRPQRAPSSDPAPALDASPASERPTRAWPLKSSRPPPPDRASTPEPVAPVRPPIVERAAAAALRATTLGADAISALMSAAVDGAMSHTASARGEPPRSVISMITGATRGASKSATPESATAKSATLDSAPSVTESTAAKSTAVKSTAARSTAARSTAARSTAPRSTAPKTRSPASTAAENGSSSSVAANSVAPKSAATKGTPAKSKAAKSAAPKGRTSTPTSTSSQRPRSSPSTSKSSPSKASRAKTRPSKKK
jgi:hypothetical protein